MADIEFEIISNEVISVDILGYASGGVTSYTQLTDVPIEFNPTAHTQEISTIVGLQPALDLKVDEIVGKQLSTEDYTTSEKSKLAGIQSGAEVNINADYNAVSGDAQILNKPNIPSIARQSISETVVGLNYDNSTGVISLTNGYLIPTLTNFNNKVEKEVGKELSENDFTDALKAKLDNIEPNADVNTVDSVNGAVGIVALDTDDIPEGLNNFYYTNSKVDARITAQKGIANGIASLDATGKVPTAQLPEISGGGGTVYKGTWDASTGNFPTLTPSDGEFWVISVAGTINLIAYSVGDWIIYYTGTGWDRVPSGSVVSSVNSKTGAVVLSSLDISENTNLYYTEDRVNNNTQVQKGVTAYGYGNHASAGYALDASVVHDAGNETVYGNKTFDDTLYINDRLNVGSSTFDITNPEFLKVDGGVSASVNIISGYSDYDDYVQLNIKNKNDGVYASSDFVATADIGQEGANYIDMGINNSNYASPEFDIVGALDGYVVIDGGDLAVGTASTDKDIVFFTGGTLQENKRATISDSGMIVEGTISASNLSGTNTGDQDLSNLATKTELQAVKNLAIAMAVAL